MRDPSFPAACLSNAATSGSILVIGGDGQVGSVALRDLAEQDYEVTGTTRRTAAAGDSLFLDLSLALEDWPELPLVNAAMICTAATRINECEDDPNGTIVVPIASAGWQ